MSIRLILEMKVMAVTTAQVQELYVAYLGRAADVAGLNYWMAELNAEPAVLTLENLRANFVNEQAEYAAIYGGLSREETVVQIYNNLFGRAPDAAGLAYWTTGEGAAVNADQLLVAFIGGAAPADAQVITNKVLVSNIYTQIAGSNFSLADAAKAIANVDGTTVSVSDAIAELTSLPSVSVPGAVALVQAAAVAAKAVADFENKANTDALIALNAKLVALNTSKDIGANLLSLDGNSSGAVEFTEALGALNNAQKLRDAADGTFDGKATSIAVLNTLATEAASDLAAARTALVNGTTGALTAVKTYEAAYAKYSSLTWADEEMVALRIAQLNATATVQQTKWDEAVGKLTDAVVAEIDGSDPITAAELYGFLSSADTSSAFVSAVKLAFSSIEGFNAVADLAAQDRSKELSSNALDDAEAAVKALVAGSLETALDEVYLAKFEANGEAAANLSNAKAADVLLNDIKAIVDSYNSLNNASDNAAAALYKAGAAVAFGTVGTANADVFFFGTENAGTETSSVRAVAGNDDLTVGVTAGDILYIGTGYTLNSTATFNDSTNFIVGGNNGVKEIFFIQNDGKFQVVIETTDFGSAAEIPNGVASDNVAVITLTGVDSLEQLSFANGMISIA